jgi:hypothetical protein
MHKPIIAATLFALSGLAALSQTATPTPQPGPEHQRLAYLVGKWNSEAEMKPGAFGPGGHMTFTQDCDWYSGGFAVVCHSVSNWAGGAVKALSITSYDPGEKRYVYFETNTSGENVFAKGTIDGPTWTWLGESRMGGKLLRNRFILKEVPPDVATYTDEIADGDGPWAEVMHGKQTRVK